MHWLPLMLRLTKSNNREMSIADLCYMEYLPSNSTTCRIVCHSIRNDILAPVPNYWPTLPIRYCHRCPCSTNYSDWSADSDDCPENFPNSQSDLCPTHSIRVTLSRRLCDAVTMDRRTTVAFVMAHRHLEVFVDYCCYCYYCCYCDDSHGRVNRLVMLAIEAVDHLYIRFVCLVQFRV